MINQHQTIRDNIAKYNKPNPLTDFLIPLTEGKTEIDILDVGSGAYSVIGSYLENKEINIIHIDNQDFTDFYKKYNFEPVVDIYQADMEKLSFQDNIFDIVTCINALDHTNSVHKALNEMIRVCRPGGYVYIDCHLDQLDTGHKHKWNAMQNGVFMNNVGIKVDLRDFGFEIKYIDNGGENRYNKIIAKLQK